ncbi:hypothetical protein NQZ68_009367 [Dissostichus eleginoides]|nr:hypothetical protein NQZ68_009367 [Dissostichus eleginoides]
MPALSSPTDIGSSPPSPVDSSPRRLSWGKLVQRLADFSTSANNSSIESGSNNGSRSDLSESGSDVCGDLSPCNEDLFYDPMEETILKEVVDLIAGSLKEAKDCSLRCSKLLIPEKLLEHIGQELLHLAASEPCGLRGALIDLCVECGSVICGPLPCPHRSADSGVEA